MVASQSASARPDLLIRRRRHPSPSVPIHAHPGTFSPTTPAMTPDEAESAQLARLPRGYRSRSDLDSRRGARRQRSPTLRLNAGTLRTKGVCRRLPASAFCSSGTPQGQFDQPIGAHEQHHQQPSPINRELWEQPPHRTEDRSQDNHRTKGKPSQSGLSLLSCPASSGGVGPRCGVRA
jgi:hypothetical protein